MRMVSASELVLQEGDLALLGDGVAHDADEHGDEHGDDHPDSGDAAGES